MSTLTLCSYVHKGADGRQVNVLSVFIHPVPISEEKLDEAIAPMLTSKGPFDRIHVYGTPESVSAARDMFVGESAVRQRLRNMMGEPDRQIVFITWVLTGQGNFVAETLGRTEPADHGIIHLEQRFSLFDAFIKNGGLVTAGRGTHFTKPSGTHASQFLRAANALEQSAVSHQLVFWLYPLLRNRIVKRVIVDTSGIAPVAYALAYERLHRGVAETLPSIESHASYGGLDTLVVPDPEHTIFLVSASTSGSLASELIAKGARPENIFTLFYLGTQSPGTVLCQLSEDSNVGYAGIPLIGNHPADKCPECGRHSYPIPIVGDQFRTEPAKVDEITILLSDFEESARAVLDRLVSTNLFKVFRDLGNRSFELYLDLESMFGTDCDDADARLRVQDIRLRLQRLLRRGMPVHLRRIVPTAYPGTDAIANSAFTALPTELKGQVGIKASSDLLSQATQHETATLVISGCMDDAYELLGISRDLRTVQPGGSITYVSPIFRVESNLTFGDQGPKTFALLSVVAIDLPPCTPAHSWRQEYSRLEEIRYWCDLHAEDLPDEISSRLEMLRSAPASGLQENLFWPTPSGDALRLAADFTMIPTRDGQRTLSQADVFAVVTSLFHKYRQGVPGKPKLIYRTYERTVISPDSFQRFSDGVLQAAFLRAARGGDIAYANCDEAISERMLMFLLDQVTAAKHNGGPALMEYLISLLIGRLTLHPPHVRAFVSSVISAGLAPHIEMVARFIAGELEMPSMAPDWEREYSSLP
jgi:hypothetical protein